MAASNGNGRLMLSSLIDDQENEPPPDNRQGVASDSAIVIVDSSDDDTGRDEDQVDEPEVTVADTSGEEDLDAPAPQPVAHSAPSNPSRVLNVIQTNIQSSRNQQDSDSDDDFIRGSSSKIPRLYSNLDIKQQLAKEPTPAPPAESSPDEEICSICLEPWTNSGTHRLVCLKCGHLFGEACIDKWLKTQQTCPSCKRQAKRTDLRRLYVKSIKVVDNSELENALRDLEGERRLRKKVEIEFADLKLRYQLVRDELTSEKEKYNSLLDRIQNQQLAQSLIIGADGGASSSCSANSASSDKPAFHYVLEKLLPLTEMAGCRVLAFSPRQSAILVSQPSNNPMFPGFGVRRVNLLDQRITSFTPVHTKMIRDMSLNSKNDDEELLTCSLDKTLKLTNIAQGRLIHSYECSAPIWSCCFNTDNPTYLYAGLANGQVLLFDRRRIDSHVQVINSAFNAGSPVCNLNYVTRDQATMSSGVIVSQLDKISYLEQSMSNTEDYKYNLLLLENNIMSCYLEKSTRHLLVSTRPTSRHPNVRHIVHEFISQRDSDTNSIQHTLNHIQTFSGSNVQTLLARSKLFCSRNQLYGVAGCERSKSAVIWDISSSQMCYQLPSTSEILDVLPIEFKGSQFLCTLTDKHLRTFKRVES